MSAALSMRKKCVAGLLSAAVWLGGPAAVAAQSQPSGASAGPNILLVTVDSLRADALGCYGRSPSVTPHLDALAAQGTLFDSCVASVPLGLPSHATILTGLQPFQHGVRDNLVFRLPADKPTLAARLSGAGYAAAAEVGSSLLQRGFGLERGFGDYREPDSVPGGVDNEMSPLLRPGSAVVDSAIAWLRQQKSTRYFLWVNLADALAPALGGSSEAGQATDSAYFAAVAGIDAQLGRLLAELGQLELAEQTLVIVTGSHGEALGRFDEPTHGYFLSDDVLRVPLILRGPGVPAGTRSTAQARLVDLAPTLLAAAGLPAPDGNGSSLLALLNVPTEAADRPAYSESLRPARRLGCSALFSLRADGWLYVRGGRERLYRVGHEGAPGEDVAAGNPDVVRRLGRQLDELLAAAGPIGADPGGPDPYDSFGDYRTLLAATALDADLERAEFALQELIRRSQRPAVAAAAHVALADALLARKMAPRAIEHYRAALEAQDDLHARRGLGRALLADSKLGQALREYERIVQTEPVLAVTHFEFALALTQKERFVEAIDQLQKALQRDPTYAHAQAQIGDVLTRMRLTAPALQAFEQATQIAPTDAMIRRRFVLALIEQHQAERAVRVAQDGVERTPADGDAYRVLALAQRAVGQPGPALQALHRAVEVSPESGAAWLDLGDEYLNQRRYAEAEKVYRDGIARVPSDRMLHNGLAWLLAASPIDQQRNPTEAARIAEELTRATGGFDPHLVDTLAAAKAALGDWPAAQKSIERAITMAKKQLLQDYLYDLDARYMLYKDKKPFRLPPPSEP